MSEMAVAIISPDQENRTILQMAVDATGVANTVGTWAEYPLLATDVSLRRIQETHAHVVLIDLVNASSSAGVRAIDLLHSELPDCAVFAIGDMRQPQLIVQAMRAGAKEFLERPVSTSAMLEALARLASLRRKRSVVQERGKAYVVLNAKGGSGATTVAVNLAISLASQGGRTAIVDLAPLGHVALHFNVHSGFNVMDALRNVERIDHSLLDGLMPRTERGVHLLAGVQDPGALEATASELAHLLDALLMQYKSVVIDLSSRLDSITRSACDLADSVLLVAQPDITSLWSANRVQAFLGQLAEGRKVQLVLNRFKKIPGFSESDAELATQLKLISKIPNEFELVTGAIEKGMPIAQQNHSQIARSFGMLASVLSNGVEAQKPRSFSFFGL
ncbi:MAG TPA: AAA family ATPase [Clostridia bacterium]|nr:AAA family ATPase [Clostridia bacterium]